MSKFQVWKERTEATLIAHEELLTGVLVTIGVLLILIAIFGKPHHKAIACFYIVL